MTTPQKPSPTKSDTTPNNEAERESQAAALRQVIEDTIAAKSSAYDVIKQFVQRNRVNRMVIDSLSNLTSNYHKLEEFDSQIATDYSSFCGLVDEKSLEDNDDPFAYSKMEALFEEYGDVKDKAIELFDKM